MRFNLTTTFGIFFALSNLASASSLASVQTPTSFDINHVTDGSGNDQTITLADYVFDSTNFLDGNTANTTEDSFAIRVDSGTASLANFDFEVVLDYTANDIAFFGNGLITGSLVGIGTPITDVFVSAPDGSSFGNFSTDGTDISFNYTIDDVLAINEGAVTISFSTETVPEPSSAVIIGLATLGFSFRRRR